MIKRVTPVTAFGGQRPSVTAETLDTLDDRIGHAGTIDRLAGSCRARGGDSCRISATRLYNCDGNESSRRRSA